MGDLSATNLTALALLTLIIMASIKYGIPAFIQLLMDSRAEVERSREYHREDKDAMRKFMSYELSEQRKSLAKFERAIERNTVAMQAALHAEDIEKALAKLDNGKSLPT